MVATLARAWPDVESSYARHSVAGGKSVAGGRWVAPGKAFPPLALLKILLLFVILHSLNTARSVSFQ